MENIPEQDQLSLNEKLVLDLSLKLLSGNKYVLADGFNLEKDKKEFIDDEVLVESFEGFDLVEPESVVRHADSTTLFTTAGVQRIEEMTKDERVPEKQQIMLFQPVIRSQFIDKINENSFTSFINFTALSIDSSYDEYLESAKKLISMIAENADDLGKIIISFKEDFVKWGHRKFNNCAITIAYNDIEVGECVYIKDYPINDQNKISITDMGLGVERVNKALFNVSGVSYPEGMDSLDLSESEINSIIDPIRSMVIIVAEGVSPSNKNHGYRLRQFSKRYVERSQGLNIEVVGLIEESLKYWQTYGLKAVRDLDEIKKIIIAENSRNTNALLLRKLKETQGVELGIDINQPIDDFIKQIGFSLSEDDIKKLINNVYER